MDDRSRIKPKVRPNYSAELFGRMYIRFLPNIRPNNLSKNCYICQQIFKKSKDFFRKKKFSKIFPNEKNPFPKKILAPKFNKNGTLMYTLYFPIKIDNSPHICVTWKLSSMFVTFKKTSFNPMKTKADFAGVYYVPVSVLCIIVT